MGDCHAAGASAVRWCLLTGMAPILGQVLGSAVVQAQASPRERVSFNADWRFVKGDPNGTGDSRDANLASLRYSNIKDWVLPTGAAFTKDPNLANRKRPSGNLGTDVAYTQPGFDEGSQTRKDAFGDPTRAGAS